MDNLQNFNKGYRILSLRRQEKVDPYNRYYRPGFYPHCESQTVKIEMTEYDFRRLTDDIHEYKKMADFFHNTPMARNMYEQHLLWKRLSDE